MSRISSTKNKFNPVRGEANRTQNKTKFQGDKRYV